MKILENGEDSFTEFKSENFHNDSLAKTIVGFANMGGGSIYIGVEDDGSVSGISASGIEERITGICRNNISPMIVPQIQKLRHDEKVVLKVQIDKGINKPYKVNSTNKFYIRAGSASVEPGMEELVRLFQEGEYYHFEVKKIPGTDINDMNRHQIQDYCQNFRKMEEFELGEGMLKNLQFLSADGNATIAGLLCFGKEAIRSLPQAGLSVSWFEGIDLSAKVLENRELDGTIPFLIETAINFVKSINSVKTSLIEDGTARKDIQKFDIFTVKELIVNAFQHRDWSIFGQKIRVRVFLDRLEIFSPGKIPNTLNLENILSGNSYYRNPLISQILRDYGYSDKIGRGLFRIYKRCREFGFKKPEIITDLHSFTIVVYSQF